MPLLDRPEVHGGVAAVDVADPVDAARVEENALGERSLARIDVGHDADVASLDVALLESHGGLAIECRHRLCLGQGDQQKPTTPITRGRGAGRPSCRQEQTTLDRSPVGSGLRRVARGGAWSSQAIAREAARRLMTKSRMTESRMTKSRRRLSGPPAPGYRSSW